LAGSPPHAWGHRCAGFLTCDFLRFTPTRVGTSNLFIPYLYTGGSPPHAWGHRKQPVPRPSDQRFTPTRVGTSLLTAPAKVIISVHPHTRGDILRHGFLSLPSLGSPHTRGDILCSIPCLTECGGSPPHAWGHRVRAGDDRAIRRFTPTRVGTSQPLQRSCAPTAVHPHTRGDICLPTSALSAKHGSPPHAWGHRVSDGVPGRPPHFTPTRVGTSP